MDKYKESDLDIILQHLVKVLKQKDDIKLRINEDGVAEYQMETINYTAYITIVQNDKVIDNSMGEYEDTESDLCKTCEKYEYCDLRKDRDVCLEHLKGE